MQQIAPPGDHGRVRVHVLFESADLAEPFGCSFIRLLRPLGHPENQDWIDLTWSATLPDRDPDVLVVDRLWRHDVSPKTRLDLQGQMLREIQKRNVPLLYSLDDNLLDSIADRASSENQLNNLACIRFIRAASTVVVSTDALAERVARIRPPFKIANYLDETLWKPTLPTIRSAGTEKVKFGYMGTWTHFLDLMSVVGPLRRFLWRYRDRVEFEIVGGATESEISGLFEGIAVNIKRPGPTDMSYPRFVDWMRSNIDWDFAIAPLAATSIINATKSDIKFLDYSILGIPGIYSDSAAYTATVRHTENGLLVPDSSEAWFASLEMMAFNGEMRERMRRSAFDYVFNERCLHGNAYRWRQAIEPLIGSRARKSHHKEKILSRNEKILVGLDPSKPGLEIGPSYSPVAPKRAGFNVKILDHADANELKSKYASHGVDVSQIEEVDYIWRGEGLADLVGCSKCFSWIIASHLIEHTPDLVAFLNSCMELLEDDGILSLVIPDCRYCFDCFRPPSTPGECIDAHLQKRKTHTAGTVWDHFSMTVKRDDHVSWSMETETGELTLLHRFEEAVGAYRKAQTTSEYMDVHHWRFTPQSFKFVIEELRSLHLIGIEIVRMFDTVGCEFYVQLRGAGPAQSNRTATTKLDSLRRGYSWRSASDQ